MKTEEELNALKEEVETVNRKLHELTEEELAQVSGGVLPDGDELDIELPGFELDFVKIGVQPEFSWGE